MAAPTNVLQREIANPEPSTHGLSRHGLLHRICRLLTKSRNELGCCTCPVEPSGFGTPTHAPTCTARLLRFVCAAACCERVIASSGKKRARMRAA
jgi:hypothetical protein